MKDNATPSASTHQATSRSTTLTESATKNASAASSASNIVEGLLGDSAVQEAVVQKGIEVAGKMIDKQLQIIDEAQNKSAVFLDKGVSCVLVLE